MTRPGPRICSFPPVAAPDARILILGSMPGEASLAAGQYYAHPRNDFWKIMDALVGAGPAVAYAERLQILQERHIALWDVLASCRRAGSLDSAIGEEEANDFEGFLAGHPAIRAIFFNGGKAESAFKKVHMAGIAERGIRLARLPSTSPAHAARSFEQKYAAWREILAALV